MHDKSYGENVKDLWATKVLNYVISNAIDFKANAISMIGYSDLMMEF